MFIIQSGLSDFTKLLQSYQGDFAGSIPGKPETVFKILAIRETA